ncbi:MerR family transcriptional regulator [Agrobacterium vitis]|uniref:MerR family transcriptional regulator n=1 Tax=Agrobacterium vitis TaxID=373 RepID=UPI0018D97746|nr:helix-turn-helix domain-containing protein [Agrobacterium vitis]QZO06699.1 helix-turn-helix domain-containing protein [Agrobacterium vitis]
MMTIAIGEAARISGVKVATIRYYEQVGLVPQPPRTDGNRRLYSAAHLQRLTFIRHARELGFEVDAIRTLLDLQDKPGQSCSPADSIARQRLADVEERIDRLKALKTELERMITGCSHGTIAECRVIEVLADHDQCRHDRH